MSRLDEGQEVRVDDVGVRRAHAVRIARVQLKGAVLELLDGQLGRVRDCYDLVIVAVHDQCRNLDCAHALAAGEIRWDAPERSGRLKSGD